MFPALPPCAPGLGVRRGLEYVLNGPVNRRDRTGLPQPRAATLGQERAVVLTIDIAREKNDPLA